MYTTTGQFSAHDNKGDNYAVHVNYNSEIPATLLFKQGRALLKMYEDLLNQTIRNPTYDQNGNSISVPGRFLSAVNTDFTYVTYFYQIKTAYNDPLGAMVDLTLQNKTNMIRLYQNALSALNYSLPNITDIGGGVFFPLGRNPPVPFTQLDVGNKNITHNSASIEFTLSDDNGYINVCVHNSNFTITYPQSCFDVISEYVFHNKQYALQGDTKNYTFYNLTESTDYTVLVQATKEGFPPICRGLKCWGASKEFHFTTTSQTTTSNSLERSSFFMLACSLILIIFMNI